MQQTATVVAMLTSGVSGGREHLPRRDFEYGNALLECGYAEVRLAPGAARQQLEQTHALLMSLNDNSLLRPFRLRAGLPAVGSDLGGWYSSEMYCAETFGQWISALARYYAISHDQETRLKVHRLLDGFSATINSPDSVFSATDRANQTGSYFYDKLVCGIIDAHQFTGYPDAFEVLSRLTRLAKPCMPGQALDALGAQKGAHESYTIPENQFLAWQRGGSASHLEMATEYLCHSFFDPLSRGENNLAGRHAYSHVNALCSAAKAFLVLGDAEYLKAAINGFSLVQQQSFATGAWGPQETFVPVPAHDWVSPATGENLHFPAIASLGESLECETRHFETGCGSYAHFKLARYLLRVTKDSLYGDSMERVMYNAVLGALPLNKFGNAFYYSNYSDRAHKSYFDGFEHNMEDEWPCCSGTLSQVVCDYHISTYFRDADGVFVNLFIPSTLRWKQGDADIALTQTGMYPLEEKIAFEITASRSVRASIRLRIPAWAKAPSIRINGETSSEELRSGAFAAIHRLWKNGDRLELELPRSLELEAVDTEHRDTVALVCGPMVLFALSNEVPKFSRSQLLAARQMGRGIPEWEAQSANGPVRLKPFWVIKGAKALAMSAETYFTYFHV